jgi:hypothetical protein
VQRGNGRHRERGSLHRRPRLLEGHRRLTARRTPPPRRPSAICADASRYAPDAAPHTTRRPD